MIRELVFDPDAFMRRRADEPGFAGPALVVLLSGLAGILSGVLLMQSLAANIEGGMGRVLAIGGVPIVIGGFVGAFLFWLLYAGVFYVISMAFDGEGDFSTTLSLVGWGFLPSIVGGVVTAVGMYLALQNATVPSDPAGMASFVQQMQSTSTYLAVSVIGIVFTLWQGFIWTFAVKHARNLDLRGAALTVAVPVAVSILWTLRSLL